MRAAVVQLFIAVIIRLIPSAEPFFKKRPNVAAALILLLIALAVGMFFGGCAALPEKPKIDSIYMHNLKVEVNGKTIRGMGVVPLASEYRLRIYPEGKVDRLILRSCYREIPIDKPEKGWFKDCHEMTIVRDPVEGNASCALEIDALEEKKKRSAWSVIDFPDYRSHVNIPAVVRCNGRTVEYPDGVSVCQSAIGLVSQYTFPTPVVVNPDPGCEGMASTDQKTYTLIMPRGKCTYYFRARERHANGERMAHRLNTIGYTDIPPVE